MKLKFSEAISLMINPIIDIKDIINMIIIIIKVDILIVKEMYQNGSIIKNHQKN